MADKAFDVELRGPRRPDTTIFFVHGFGVRRDSRGLFPAIAQGFPDSLCVAGNFSDPVHNRIKAVPFSAQEKRLRAIVEYTEDRFRPQKVFFLGHSQGSIVISLFQPRGSRVLLLAPPMEAPYEKFIATPGWSRPGSSFNREGLSRLVRSEGIIEADPDFWNEFRKIDAISRYKQLGRDNEVSIVFAGADEVLGQQKSLPGIFSDSVDGADHDFAGNCRNLLLRVIRHRIYRDIGVPIASTPTVSGCSDSLPG